MVFAILNWTPTLIMRRFNTSEDVAGVVMGLTGVFTIPGVLLSGFIADRWQRKNPAGRMWFATVMVLFSTIGVVLSIYLIFFLHKGDFNQPGIWAVLGIVCFALFCVVCAAVTSPVMAATQSLVSQDMKGLVWGLGVTIILVMGGAWSPAATGYLSDWMGGGFKGLAIALNIICSLGFLSFICFCISSKHFPADARKVK